MSYRYEQIDGYLINDQTCLSHLYFVKIIITMILLIYLWNCCSLLLINHVFLHQIMEQKHNQKNNLLQNKSQLI